MDSISPVGYQEMINIFYTEEDAPTKIARFIKGKVIPHLHQRELIFLCIGTDRSTGDALGPMVGMKLKERFSDLPVFGTLEEPVHALNLKDHIHHIYQKYDQPYVIAVDASLGRLKSVGMITAAEGPLRPGAGVHKDLIPVGDLHLTGIVNIGGFMEYFVLQNTRLSLVMKMAGTIATAFSEVLADLGTTLLTPFAYERMNRAKYL